MQMQTETIHYLVILPEDSFMDATVPIGVITSVWMFGLVTLFICFYSLSMSSFNKFSLKIKH